MRLRLRKEKVKADLQRARERKMFSRIFGGVQKKNRE